MEAWVVNQYGDYKEVLQWGEFEAPEPEPGEALLKIGATGVSFALILRIQGKYQDRDPLPFVPGNDVAGEVVAVGAGSRFAVGQRVAGRALRGGFSQYATVPNDITHVIPDEMGDVDAAALLNSYQTSWIGLKHHGRVQPGDVVLVHGAAGALGLAAVQIAKRMGATVIATASSAEKLAACKKYGADHGINYVEEDFCEGVMEFTKGHGADVIYDPVGGDVFDASRRCIAFRGRLVVVGFTSGRIPEIGVNRIMLRCFSVDGFTLHGYRAHRIDLLDECQQEVFRLYKEEDMKPVIHEVLPLARLPEALSLIEQRKSIGKIICVPENGG